MTIPTFVLESFIWVFKTSLITSVLIGVIFILRLLLKGKISHNILFYLWLVIIIKLLLPYGPESNISIQTLLNKMKNTITYEDKIVNTNLNIQSITEDISLSKNNSSKISNIIKDSPQEKFSVNNISTSILEIIAIIWLMGIAVFITIAVISNYRFKRNISLRILKPKDDHRALMNECLNILKINKDVNLTITDKVSTPSIFGVFKPKILLPATLVNEINKNELRYILLHELCHLKRKDILISWIIYLVKSIYWFNPIVLLALNTMKDDCELACDSMVLSHLDKKEYLVYGNTIINILGYMNYKQRIVGATTMISSKNKLKERIKVIGENKRFGLKSVILGTVVILSISLVGLTTGVTKGETINNINNNNSTKVVVYNSHKDEAYSDGNNVVEAAKELTTILEAKNMNAQYVENTEEVEYSKSYEASRSLIQENVKDYDKSILIDIHRQSVDIDGIRFEISKDSKNYEKNLEFAQMLIRELNNNGVYANLSVYEVGQNSFNLDLSEKSLIVELGDENSSKSDVENLINALADVLNQIK